MMTVNRFPETVVCKKGQGKVEIKKAIEALQGQINLIDTLKQRDAFSPDFEKWQRDTEVAIERIFGKNGRHISDFRNIKYGARRWVHGTPECINPQRFYKGLDNAKGILQSMKEEIEGYGIEKNVRAISEQPSKDNWEAIKKEYGISKKDFGRKMNFVKDRFKRKIIFRDAEHAYVLATQGFAKPAIILAGGVIEELLRLYLEHKNIKSKSESFSSYITACDENDLLKRGVSRLTDSIRDFRNFVHIAKEETIRHTLSKATAKGAVSSIFTIASDFQ